MLIVRILIDSTTLTAIICWIVATEIRAIYKFIIITFLTWMHFFLAPLETSFKCIDIFIECCFHADANTMIRFTFINTCLFACISVQPPSILRTVFRPLPIAILTMPIISYVVDTVGPSITPVNWMAKILIVCVTNHTAL